MYDDHKDIPEFVFATKPVKFSGFDVSKLFDDFDEESMCEDFSCEEALSGCETIEDAIRAFNEANKDRTIFWQEDTTRKVRVPKDECLEDDDDNHKPGDGNSPPLRKHGVQGIDKRF